MNEDVKSTSVHIHSRADELIACLEGEIAKRDEELAACRVAVENCDLFRARIVELEADRDRIKTIADNYSALNMDSQAELSALKAQDPVAYIPVDRETGKEWHPVLKKGSGNICDYKPLYAAPVSEAKAQVVMPERAIKDGGKFSTELKVTGWNACLDEVARLNAAPVHQVSVPDDFVCDSKPLQELLNATAMLLETPCQDSATYWAAQLANVEQLLAAPAAPAADALYKAVTPDVVEWLRCGLAANNRLVDGTHHALERVRAALAAHRANGVV